MIDYSITITKEINHPKLHKEVAEHMPNLLGFHNIGILYHFNFNDTFDNLLLEQIILNHNHVDLVANEVEMYLKRIEDGQLMSIYLMSELRLESVINGYNRDVNRYIEIKLHKVKINIDRGWWVTALETLENIVVESYFTQELYDKLHNTITNYILINYPTSY